MKRIFTILTIILFAAVTAVGQYTAGAVSGGGTITGKVSFEGTPPVMKPLKVQKDAAVCAKLDKTEETVLVGSGGGLKNAVVFIEKTSSGKAFPEKVQINQNGCRFEPHVQLIGVGQRLTILNSDGILHNIHTFGTANPPVNKAQPKFKKRLPLKFKKAEFFKIKCDVHAWMTGWIVVGEHPYYVVTGDDGSFSLTDVPPGTYKLNFWHEMLGEQSQDVTVTASGTATANASFSM